MSIVAIVGAGILGGTLAYTIAARDKFREVRLIDETSTIAAGKALDIKQSGPIEHFRTVVSGFNDAAAAADADIVILTGPAHASDTEWNEDIALAFIDRHIKENQRQIIICAGASHRGVVERSVTDVGIPRRRIIGSAPEAFRAAITAIVALNVNRAPSDVGLTIMGAPPKQTIVPWSQVTISGFDLDQQLSVTHLRRLQEQIPYLWPPGPYTLAAAAARVAELIINHTNKTPTCFAVLNGEFRIKNISIATPIILAPNGIKKIPDLPLSTREQFLLQNVVPSNATRSKNEQ